MLNKKNIKITYLGGAWPTNIGNAFIDMGSMQLLKESSSGSVVYFTSEFPQWLFYNSHMRFNYGTQLASWITSDFLVVSGMMLCEEFIKLYEPIISNAIKRGTRFIINGGGGKTYTRNERAHVRSFLKRNPPYAFISRDNIAFNYYHDLAQYAYNGIDCGFFVSDGFDIAKLNLPEFVIFNIDKLSLKTILEFLHEEQSIGNRLIIHVHHNSWPLRKPHHHLSQLLLRRYTYKRNTLVSDIPNDYLQLYANTTATYTTRVHACVASFAFGKPSRLLSSTRRASLFDRVNLGSVRNHLTFPNMKTIQMEKAEQVKFLSHVLSIKNIK